MFINGLPVITFELKNQFAKHNVDDAVHQYKHDRNLKELLFIFKRCMVHFALDNAQIKFYTKLDGKASWFLPFNKEYKDDEGNLDWEKLSIFLDLLIPKLPSPPEDDFVQRILEAIDLDSY